MALDEETVHANLDAKMRLFGFEVKNIVAAMALGGLLSSLGGDHLLVTLASVAFPIVLLLTLQRIDLRQPEYYLRHLFTYYVSPKFFSAAEPDPRLEAAITRKLPN